MKILWFAHRDIKNPRSGGAERTIYEVCSRLCKMHVEVHLVTVNPGNLLNYEIVDGIITHRITGNIIAHLSVRKMIKKIKPDVIVDDMGHAVPWFSSWFTDIPVIVFFRHLHARSLPGIVYVVSYDVNTGNCYIFGYFSGCTNCYLSHYITNPVFLLSR